MQNARRTVFTPIFIFPIFVFSFVYFPLVCLHQIAAAEEELVRMSCLQCFHTTISTSTNNIYYKNLGRENQQLLAV
jgi:hypothetical protein